MPNDDHEHHYTKITGQPINRIENNEYKGTAGDKTILYRVCRCGHKRAFEYGETDKMREVYAKTVSNLPRQSHQS